jgi:hypothetical protein
MHNTPQHNRVAESLNQRIMEHICAFIIQSGLPKMLWGKAANHVIWLKNHSITCMLGNVTPYKKLTKGKPNLAGMPEWGQ